jgi:trans-aconitate methyltransferase
MQALYSDLVSWYRLVDPPEDHAEEAASYRAAFERAAAKPLETLLELGSGGGHNAVHLKERFQCTLADRSAAMLALSRELNPDCEHLVGDMRSLRLGRTFDVVLVHDAVVYMTTEGELLAAAKTAFTHTAPGGVAIFAPDTVRETFREMTEVLEGEEGSRSLRCLMWTWDPDPADTTCVVDFAFLLRESGKVTAVHDQHVEGLFSRSAWERILGNVGYDVEAVPRQVESGYVDDIFLCRRRV